MKQLIGDRGGRAFTNDDWQTLQDELSAAAFAPYLGQGPFVVVGCQVSGNGPTYTVAPGLVMLDGEFRRFYGATDVSLPAQFQLGTVQVVQERPYQDAVTRTCIGERRAELVPIPAQPYTDGEFLPVTAQGSKRLEHVRRAAVRDLHELQHLAAPGYMANNYDASGKGLVYTEAWGWALANGNNDTADLRGQFVLVHNPDRPDFTNTTPGQTGGEETHRLTVPEMPRHAHPYTDRYTVERNAIDEGNNTRRDQDAVDNKTTGEVGGDVPHNNMPPWYAAVVRQWVGFSL